MNSAINTSYSTNNSNENSYKLQYNQVLSFIIRKQIMTCSPWKHVTLTASIEMKDNKQTRWIAGILLCPCQNLKLELTLLSMKLFVKYSISSTKDQFRNFHFKHIRFLPKMITSMDYYLNKICTTSNFPKVE